MDAKSLIEMAARANADQAFERGGMSPEMLQRMAQETTNRLNQTAARSDNLGEMDYGYNGEKFGEVFNEQMRKKGAGKTFSWKGKPILLKYADAQQPATAAPDFSGGVSGAIQRDMTGVPPEAIDFSGVVHGGYPMVQRNSDTYNIGVGGIQLPEEQVTAQRPYAPGFEESFDAGINDALSGIRGVELPEFLNFLRPAKPYR